MIRLSEEVKILAKINNWSMLGASSFEISDKKRVIRPVIKLVTK